MYVKLYMYMCIYVRTYTSVMHIYIIHRVSLYGLDGVVRKVQELVLHVRTVEAKS